MDYKRADAVLSSVMEIMRETREEQGLSLKKLGALSGVERTTIGKMEAGKRSPSLHACLRVADALGLDLGDVLQAAMKERVR